MSWRISCRLLIFGKYLANSNGFAAGRSFGCLENCFMCVNLLWNLAKFVFAQLFWGITLSSVNNTIPYMEIIVNTNVKICKILKI